jgi:hypothetical protein
MPRIVRARQRLIFPSSRGRQGIFIPGLFGSRWAWVFPLLIKDRDESQARLSDSA